MSIRTVCFIAVFLLGVTLSYGYNTYDTNNEAKRAWMKAREEGLTSGKNMVLVINSDGQEVGRRAYSYSAVCKRGYVVDQVAADESFTCKKAPGKRRRIKCKNVYASFHSVYCPGSMYVNSWWTEGTIKKIRCCGEKRLSYSEDNCDFINVKLGEPFGVSEGKYWPGFGSNDGGVNWKVKECIYDSK